jgi:AraC family transcriptional regulator, arabinose operon regulatory protein
MNLQNVHLLGIGLHIAKPDWRLANQLHTHHELIIVTAGRQFAEIRGAVYTIGAGEAVCFLRQELHTEWTDPQNPVRSFFISLTWPELPTLPQHHVIDQEGRIGQLAHWLYAERQAGSLRTRPTVDAFTSAVVAEFFRLAAPHETPLVRDLRHFMREHLAQRITLDDLAAQCGLSKYHFVRRYRTLTGRTPMEDLRRIRLDAARDLLLTTTLPLKEIAPRCGLHDEFHLCRLYRKQAGHPPGQLRRRR